MTGFWTLHAPAALAVVVPVLMTPGLDVAAIARNAVGGGRRAGIAAATGSTLGASLCILGAAAGMGALTDLVPEAEGVLRVLGAAVLWWVASWFLSAALGTSDCAETTRPAPVAGAAFRDGSIASALNPKSPLFFAEVFGASGVAQASMGERIGFCLLLFGLHFAWFVGVALVLDRVGAWPGNVPVIRIGAGAVSIVLAAAGVLALRSPLRQSPRPSYCPAGQVVIRYFRYTVVQMEPVTVSAAHLTVVPGTLRERGSA